MTADTVYALGGLVLLIAVVLPHLLHRIALSAPIVLILTAFVIGLLPLPGGVRISPVEHRMLIEHMSELTVITALMGVGLALDRPLKLRSWRTWRRWGATWRLLGIAMPLSIAGTALLGWWVMGIAPAAALLLGAALAPTDPVLAADVQVEGPTTEEMEHVDEADEVRFALTSEAGLNDALAFPFVYAAIFLAEGTPVSEFLVRLFAWELLGKTAIGLVVGVLAGQVLGWIAFRSEPAWLRFADQGEPLLALGATLLAYGVAELVGGWGFLAVFACALSLRASERHHDYHGMMHALVERLELLFTLVMLTLLGLAIGDGLLLNLTWQGVVVGLALILVVRPLAGLAAFRGLGGLDRLGERGLGPKERLVTAFFGVRGVGSIYYLAYALGVATFADPGGLWATAAFTILASVVIHGILATPAMRWLDDVRSRS